MASPALRKVWQFENWKGWENMPAEWGDRLSELHLEGVAVFEFTWDYDPKAPPGQTQEGQIRYVPYLVDFTTMLQINQRTGYIRRIKMNMFSEWVDTGTGSVSQVPVACCAD